MQRNLTLYPLYQLARSGYFWLPVFFLYFASRLPASDVLRLEAIYFFAVVVLEVPSGYFSDRVGRRVTLLISAAATVAAGALFAATSSFAAFAAGQVLLAVAMSFNSGTDSALLYDSLQALRREGEIGAIEARAQTWEHGSLAAAAIIGGAVAGWDLRLAYVLSSAAGVLAFACAWGFIEPPRPARASHAAEAPLQQARAVLGRLRDPQLAWLLGFAVALTVIAHVPYEFFQPYLAFVLGDEAGQTRAYTATPLVSGALVGAAMAGAALASSRAMAIDRRLGTRLTLLGALVIEGVIITVMGLVLHPVVIALIALRSAPMAVARPVMNARIHPRIATGIRATYLSVQSLSGRLAFSITLALASFAIGDAAMTAGIMSDLLIAFTALTAGFVVLLAATSRAITRQIV